MAEISDRFQPSFVLFPIQNARTGLREVNQPVVLVVPFSRTADGIPVSDSGISNVRYFIEDAPGKVPVAGFQNAGIFVPDFERFSITLTALQLADSRIELEGLPFFDQDTGQSKQFEDAVEGDTFQITLDRGIHGGPGVTDTLTYLPDANYYDLSRFTIDTEDLKPFGRYNFVWQADYLRRIITDDEEFECISDPSLARLSILYAHPGEVHEAILQRLVPSLYFGAECAPLGEDLFAQFVRPFMDVLQDIFDEQAFLERANHVESIPAQLIPYLSFLLGWDLPYFPGSTDNIRRNVLRNARRLQQLKGSRRAIIELFEIFGFTVDIVNLWYSQQGTELLAPEADGTIGLETVCQTEPLVSEYTTSGFGQLEVPLLFRPESNITITAWLVESGSSAENDLRATLGLIDQDPTALESTSCVVTPDGFLMNPSITVSSPVIGFSEVLVDPVSGMAVEQAQVNEAPLNINGLTYDRDTNILSITFDHYLEFNNSALYILATYDREKIVVPESLDNSRSNRFDISILFRDGEQPTSQVYEFLLDFVIRLKAFHSLLRKIVFTVQLTEVYNVIDFCLGGQNKQAPGTDAGELQAPPAICPVEDPECGEDRGFSDQVKALRSAIIGGLEEEHAAWKALDGQYDIPADERPLLESLSRLAIPEPDGASCEYNPRGQDRVLDAGTKDFDHTTDDREKLCSLTGNADDYCYKGRVQADLLVERRLALQEYVRCRPCGLMMGNGNYYESPLAPETPVTGSISRCDREAIGRSYLDTLFARVKSYPSPTIHYTDRPYFRSDLLESNEFFAIRRPSLEVEKDNLFFPGHRFVNMFAIESDIEVTEYDFRPWDAIFFLCPENLPTDAPTLDDLDPQLVTNTDGDEELVFNEITLVYFGNGLVPDISGLDSHEDRDYRVTHQIYTTASEAYADSAGSPITQDSLVFTDVGAICTDDPIFRSANRNCDCPDDAVVEVGTDDPAVDFIDGYPAVTGRYIADLTSFDAQRESTDAVDVELVLCFGLSDETGANLLFKLGSGIEVGVGDPAYRYYVPHRLDCSCEYYDCGTTGEPDPVVDRCNIDYYRLGNGELDPDCDRVEFDQIMLLSECVGTCSIQLDGTIPNLLCFDADAIDLPFDEKFPPSGQYLFVDEYGIIYDGMFEVFGDRIDITQVKRDPRVAGEPDSGYVENRRVFRRGTVTTCRQIMEGSDTSVTILAEGSEQVIETFQSNFVCGDPRPSDPFAYHLDCGVIDELEIEIVPVGTGGTE